MKHIPNPFYNFVSFPFHITVIVLLTYVLHVLY